MLWMLLSLSACAQYHSDAWTADTGLPQNIIRGIHQTPDGYMWIATLDGIARFDGVHFAIFNKNNTPGLASNRISSMVGGKDGDLWLVSENGRLTRYHRGSFQTYGKEQGLPEDSTANSIASDESGVVWVLFADTALRWDEASGRFSSIPLKFRGFHYRMLRWGVSGFWGTDGKILDCFAQGRFIESPLPAWLPGSSLREVAVDAAGTTWLETQDGAHVRIANGKATIEPANTTIEFVDRQKHVWKMRLGRQLDRSIEGTKLGANAPSSFSQLAEDREGSLWLGTEGQGLYRLQRQSVQVYTKEHGLIDRNIYPIFQDHTGAVWIGAWNSGLSRYKAGSFTNYSVADGLLNPLVTALYEDRSGRVWVATHGGGIRIFVNGRLQKSPWPILSSEIHVQAILQDRQGTFWFATSRGLLMYRDGVSRTYTTSDGLTTNDLHVLLESKTGDLWIGGYGGLTRFHDGRFVAVVPTEAARSDSIRSLYEDKDGVLWIGTYDNGFDRLKDGRMTRYTTVNGLYDNGAFQILEDAHANLWMSSNRGIYRVSKQDLNEFADNKRKTITSVAFGTIDGMLNAECNGGLSPAGARMADGTMWFPTQNGVAIIDPETVSRNPQAPPVVIESSLLDHLRQSVTGPLTILPGKENLEIQYTALSYIKSSQIQFRYKMDGLDADWIDAGSRRTAYYSHLPPGKYLFHVIAGNSDGVWNEAGQSLPVEVIAPFYRTWGFRTLVVIICGALMWTIAYYRIAHLQRAQVAQQLFSQQLIASQEGERKRIAAELHDSLGQRLVVIKNLALFFLRAQRQHPEDEDQAETVREIGTEASMAIEETRSIAYNLRPFQLDRLGLNKSIEGLIRSVSKSSGIQIKMDLANIDDLFPEELRINYYRIVQESLSNIMKHAQATEAEVHIVRTENSVVLSIHDNGRGFTHASPVMQAGHGGFGMTGMAERASLLGGRLKMRSEPSKGTVMTVEISLRRGNHAG
jgi:signal transduction histidine kinase/ligand-binding sensor domain-containing protein